MRRYLCGDWSDHYFHLGQAGNQLGVKPGDRAPACHFTRHVTFQHPGCGVGIEANAVEYNFESSYVLSSTQGRGMQL